MTSIQLLYQRKTQAGHTALSKLSPGGGPPPHIQTREHEGFYVTEGEITFMVDKQRIEAKPGTFVNIPPNVLHSFKNETNEIAKVVGILSPSGFEQFFVEVGVRFQIST